MNECLVQNNYHISKVCLLIKGLYHVPICACLVVAPTIYREQKKAIKIKNKKITFIQLGKIKSIICQKSEATVVINVNFSSPP